MGEEIELKLKETMNNYKGTLTLLIRKNGKVIEEIKEHNLIVDSGKVRLAQLLAGQSTAAIKYVGIGSGEDQALATDTQLKDQQLIPITETSIVGTTAHFDFFIGTGVADGAIIHEFGLFCADETMFSHRVRTGKIEKEADMEIKGYWEIEI